MATVLGKASTVQWIVSAALIFYIFTSTRTPKDVKRLVDTSAGTLVVIVIAIGVFLNTNPLTGVLALVAGYELLRRSRRSGRADGTGSHRLSQVSPYEAKKLSDFSRYNHHPATLEEEVVGNMAPLVKHAGNPNIAYQPTLHPQHSAAPVHFKGVS